MHVWFLAREELDYMKQVWHVAKKWKKKETGRRRGLLPVMQLLWLTGPRLLAHRVCECVLLLARLELSEVGDAFTARSLFLRSQYAVCYVLHRGKYYEFRRNINPYRVFSYFSGQNKKEFLEDSVSLQAKMFQTDVIIIIIIRK